MTKDKKAKPDKQFDSASKKRTVDDAKGNTLKPTLRKGQGSFRNRELPQDF